jgi:hypothetical protein
MSNTTTQHGPIPGIPSLSNSPSTPGLLLATLLSILFIAFITYTRLASPSGPQPPRLSDPIPFLYNSLQFLLNNARFMTRVQHTLSKSHPLARFRLGRHRVYLVSGAKNVQTVFGRAHGSNIHADDIMLSSTLPLWYRLRGEDLKRFASDKTGRGRVPLPGTEHTPPGERFFLGYEHVHSEFLAKAQFLGPMVEVYQGRMGEVMDGLCSAAGGGTEWTTLSVVEFCKMKVARCALYALLGPRMFELSPDFVERMWEFDDVVFPLVMGHNVGVPEWLNRRPHRVHERYLDAVRRYLDAAWAGFDWDDPKSAEARWEPHFGAQVTREVVKWFRDSGFKGRDTGAGAIGILAWA